LGWHVGAIFFVLAASAVGILLPLIAKHKPGWNMSSFIFVLGKHIGTGVLLALGFIHLLEPAVDQLSNECLGAPWTEYPFAMLFTLIATLLMHMIEMIAHTALQNRSIHTHHEESVAVSEISREFSTSQVHIGPSKSAIGHVHGMVLQTKAEQTVSAYILEFGLAAHSVIIGITVGVASNAELAALIPALCFHQLFEGIALGSLLANVNFSSAKEVVLALIFSLSSPIGIAIGIGIQASYNENSATANIVQGTLDAISAGIIFYVVFAHMLAQEFPKDFEASHGVWRKLALFAALWVGAGILAFFGIWL